MSIQETTKENFNKSGNTNSADSSFKISTRNIILTVNKKSFEHLEDIIKYLKHYKAINYILCCSHDKPEKHYHIFAQYESSRKFDSRYLYGAHIEKCYGSAQQNIKYIKGEDKKHKDLGIKCDVIFEQGTPKERGGRRIKDIKEMTDEEIEQIDASLWNIANKIRPPKKISVKEWHKKIKVYYIYGTVSGIGKTLSIYRVLMMNDVKEFLEVKHHNNFWLGISGEEITGCLIYDDFRDSDLKANEFINFIDYHVHNMSYKGGNAKNKANLIIITSILPPDKIYRNLNTETKEQWMRRIKKINLDKININMYQEAQDEIL